MILRVIESVKVEHVLTGRHVALYGSRYLSLRCLVEPMLRMVFGFRSQGRYKYGLLRWTVEMLRRDGEKSPRWPWDPRAVSDPRLVAHGAPGALTAGSNAPERR
jgi:hypothetical protein